MLSRFRISYLLFGSIILNIISPLLFALPFPPTTPYWAQGFPAMVSTLGIEFASPILALYVVQCLDKGDQALGGGLLQTANNLGKAAGLALATALQALVTDSDAVGQNLSLAPEVRRELGDAKLLAGLRAGQWTSVGISCLALGISLVFFRGLKKL